MKKSNLNHFYITTPIFYPNGEPHIGHAYNAISSDCIARFERLKGNKVLFVSGTDEHGLKMQQTAEKQGLTPQQLADKNSAVFEKMLQDLNCSNDDFIRTTQTRHHEACAALWQKMLKNGDIYQDSYKGWYSVRQESYYDEADTILLEDGSRVEKELNSPVIWNEEESYFFRLSNYQEKLLKYYDENPSFIKPIERFNEIYNFVKSGLKDLSISRTSFNWGINVPNDDTHIMYVWVDALTNYLTATGFPHDSDKNIFWPANLHVIGKDIIRFHAVYWPAFLLSAGIELPKRIFAHGFLLHQGEKMSKSLGNVISPFDLINKYGLDQVRYFFMREVPFGQDGSYSAETIVNRINADLSNDLGNLVNRCLTLVVKNFDNKTPNQYVLKPQDERLFAFAKEQFDTVELFMDEQQINRCLQAVFAVVSAANKYFANEAPWILKNTDKERFATVLYNTLEILRRIAIILQPFIPTSAEKLLNMLAIEKHQRGFRDISSHSIQAGKQLPKTEVLFPRYLND